MDIGLFLRNLLFPIYSCPVCGKRIGKEGLCPLCSDKMKTLSRCKICGTFINDKEDYCLFCNDGLLNSKSFLSSRAALPYEGLLRKNLLNFKYHNYAFWARSLAYVLQEAQEYFYPLHDFDILVPVPLSARRLQERGYNQAALCCDYLAKIINKPCSIGALERIKDTPPLFSKHRTARYTLMESCFFAKQDLVEGRRILLIDDIFTTGATAHGCSKALLKAGAKSVMVLTIASGSC
ncbi:MAG: ComF family protein [Clostridiales bacterium]